MRRDIGPNLAEHLGEVSRMRLMFHPGNIHPALITPAPKVRRMRLVLPGAAGFHAILQTGGLDQRNAG
jgi:hypothetical protein